MACLDEEPDLVVGARLETVHNRLPVVVLFPVLKKIPIYENLNNRFVFFLTLLFSPFPSFLFLFTSPLEKQFPNGLEIIPTRRGWKL